MNKTPEEEAEELIEKLKKLLEKEMIPINDVDCTYQAKQGALITVDKIIEVLENVWRDIYGEDRIIDVPNPLFEEILRHQQVRAAIEANT